MFFYKKFDLIGKNFFIEFGFDKNFDRKNNEKFDFETKYFLEKNPVTKFREGVL